MIGRNEVVHVAQLARLTLTELEIEQFTRQLDSILAYASQLDAAATTAVEPTCFVIPEHDPMRDDRAAASLSKNELLGNGPAVKNGFFSIPKVIGL